jgi:uncharacterized protein YdeI (YjbR/CyaY-like superfamily)
LATPAPIAFRTPAAFRAWMARHHGSATELVVRCYKVHAKAKGITYAQALDEALCAGWIDGVRRSIDDDSFSVRFTPRRAKSIWSAVNIKRAGELEAAGRMRPSGLEAFRARTGDNSRRYSFESRAMDLGPAYAKRLRANKRAQVYLESQPPWYRRTSTFWVMSAKREETRERRLEVLIACSEKGTPIPPLRRPAPRPSSPAR